MSFNLFQFHCSRYASWLNVHGLWTKVASLGNAARPETCLYLIDEPYAAKMRLCGSNDAVSVWRHFLNYIGLNIPILDYRCVKCWLFCDFYDWRFHWNWCFSSQRTWLLPWRILMPPSCFALFICSPCVSHWSEYVYCVCSNRNCAGLFMVTHDWESLEQDASLVTCDSFGTTMETAGLPVVYVQLSQHTGNISNNVYCSWVKAAVLSLICFVVNYVHAFEGKKCECFKMFFFQCCAVVIFCGSVLVSTSVNIALWTLSRDSKSREAFGSQAQPSLKSRDLARHDACCRETFIASRFCVCKHWRYVFRHIHLSTVGQVLVIFLTHFSFTNLLPFLMILRRHERKTINSKIEGCTQMHYQDVNKLPVRFVKLSAPTLDHSCFAFNASRHEKGCSNQWFSNGGYAKMLQMVHEFFLGAS